MWYYKTMSAVTPLAWDSSKETHPEYVTRIMYGDFAWFRSKSAKLWRLENLYFITTKSDGKQLFNLNRAQRHFVETYLICDNPYWRLIILKSRQLGFTTLINLWLFDDILWNLNYEALVVAHTLEDAKQIFNKKVSYAKDNLYPSVAAQCIFNKSSAKRVEAVFPDNSKSGISVANSGRSGTYQDLHVSEFAKLWKAFPTRAEEIITGTIQAVPTYGNVFIESTAEGMAGLYYEMFMGAWKRRDRITPAMSVAEFFPVFYNWTWDDISINSIGLINLDDMEVTDIDWKEYQKDYDLTPQEISFYYVKWQQLGKDSDKLRQEYPTTVQEAFIGTGSNYFSLKKTSEMYEKCDDNYQKYDFINGVFEKSTDGDLWIYDDVRPGRNYVLGADVAEGLENGDYTVAIVLGYDKQIKALYRGHIEPDEFAELLKVLGKRFNNAMLAVEFNKDGNWVNTELRNSNYPSIYVRTVIDDITKELTQKYGWITNKPNRDFMLGETKKHFNSTPMINCRPLLEEIMVFVRNKSGKPQAASGKHDDIIISFCIAIAVLQGREEKIEVKTKFGLLNAIFVK